jgi:uncharacterized protein
MKVDLWSSARGKKGLIDLAQKWYILPAVSALEGKVAEQATYLDQPRRVLILGVNVTIFYVAYVISSGQWAPTGAGETVWFWSAVSMWLLSLLAAPWFTPPRDAFAAAISAGVLLATTDLSQVAALAILLDVFRWAALGLAGVVLVSALAAMLLRNREPRSGFGEVCYKLSESLGRGEVMFTPPALVSISAFYQGSTGAALVLMALWVFFTVVQPVEVTVRTSLRLRALARAASDAPEVGTIQRVDHPNIIRVALKSAPDWRSGIYVATLADGHQKYVLPLFTHTQENEVIGTGLCHGEVDEPIPEAEVGRVYAYPRHEADLRPRLIRDLSGTDQAVDLVGFVVEGSSISELRFEVSMSAKLEEGTVVFANLGGRPVYYQILDASTAEESFGRNPGGKHIVSAAQLGEYDPDRAFLKYPWLPAMNGPVFRLTTEPDFNQTLAEGEFFLGAIPSAGLKLRVSIPDLAECHGAILGVTGTGKTEMALDIIRTSLDQGFKVFCVDFTGEYQPRLNDRHPQNIGLPLAGGSALEQLLFAVETGEYGAKKEKATLAAFLQEAVDLVSRQIDEFLTSEGAALGISELTEIASTKATLRTTELYLSSIMSWARQHRRARRVLIVLEEAHTIIPEAAWAGFDPQTQWVVNRIGQIALQGRKYGVGLLIVSQRTALVSKTILSQCNTYFTHALADRTSLDYLASIYSPEHVRVIPNLRPREFLAYGKAVRSERPMLVRMEWDPAKKAASDGLKVELAAGEQDVPAPELSLAE